MKPIDYAISVADIWLKNFGYNADNTNIDFYSLTKDDAGNWGFVGGYWCQDMDRSWRSLNIHLVLDCNSEDTTDWRVLNRQVYLDGVLVSQSTNEWKLSDATPVQ